MIVVSGSLYVRAGARDGFLRASHEAMVKAREAAGCLDFVVAADPIEPDRVNIYEAWTNEQALLSFRGDGPGGELMSVIVRADVSRHVISSSGPA